MLIYSVSEINRSREKLMQSQKNFNHFPNFISVNVASTFYFTQSPFDFDLEPIVLKLIEI